MALPGAKSAGKTGKSATGGVGSELLLVVKVGGSRKGAKAQSFFLSVLKDREAIILAPWRLCEKFPSF